MKEKKVPERQCLACRERKPKSDLIRIVRTPDGKVEIDRTGRLQGRGAYCCRNRECLKKIIKSGAAARALGIKPEEGLLEGLAYEL